MHLPSYANILLYTLNVSSHVHGCRCHYLSINEDLLFGLFPTGIHLSEKSSNMYLCIRV